ncbi:MAG: hypothetical protein WCR44_05965 [Verrucomicrobiota bacterium]
MSGTRRNFAVKRLLLGAVMSTALLGCMRGVMAQGVPTVQETQFRSQWVGDQVDRIPLTGTITPLNALGGVVGTLQTPDEVKREVDASMANVQAKLPFAIHPSLGVGWQISNRGLTNSSPVGQTNSGNNYSTGSSPFIAPALAILYDRDHGPFSVSAGYSVGFKYFSNPNYVANGSGSQRNPLAQTALFRVKLEMSRYIADTTVTASSGSGYDSASGANNTQTAFAANGGAKYLLNSKNAISANGGYSLLNSSGSVATPNNNTTSLYGNLSPIYELSDKTHLSSILGAGLSSQSLQSGTAVTGNVPTRSQQQTSRQYAQLMGKVKYEFTAKTVADISLGARYLKSTGISNAKYDGLKPAWAVGISYTPTEKTSATFSTGLQGTDVVPELNFLLNWHPREKTTFSFGVTQTESFANALSAQYIVSRSAIGTVTQNLFSNVTFNLSGGYGQQQYIGLSSNQTAGQSTSQLPSNYFTGTAALIWKIRDWVSLNNSLYYNSGQSVTTRGNGSAQIQAQAFYQISMNFSL